MGSEGTQEPVKEYQEKHPTAERALQPTYHLQHSTNANNLQQLINIRLQELLRQGVQEQTAKQGREASRNSRIQKPT